MAPPAWSTQQLAEFLAVVSSSESEASAALAAVERAAEALDAEVAAIVANAELVAAVGYPEGAAPVTELDAVVPGVAGCQLTVPGVGACPATAVALEHPPEATLILARSGAGGLSREEAALLRGMARVTSMTMRMLRLLDDERAAREELERLAEEQAALRRVATLVAGEAAADDIFSAVAEEVARLLRADIGGVCRYEPDESVTVMASWSEGGSGIPVGTRTGLPGEGSVSAPIVVEGRVWGAIFASSAKPAPFPDDAESRIAGFAELVATAISNAVSRAQLAASRARIVATADETRRRIERDLHDGIQQRLVALALELRGVEDAVPSGRQELLAQVRHIEDVAAAVLDELREIARGVHPAILSHGGLAPALKSLARRSSLPVEVHVGAVQRLPQPVEVAAYYSVSEALTNATKHANASVAHVDLEVRDGTLHVAIRDDGVGGADPAHGSGILGLTDRVEALGGTITVTSPPGEGTSMVLQLPVELAVRDRLARVPT